MTLGKLTRKLKLNKIKVAFVLLAAGFALLLLYFYAQKSEREIEEIERETISLEEISLLKEGDFVFRLGYGIVSYFLERQAGTSGVSHIGILVKDSLDFDIIHSISGSMAQTDGIQKISLNDFLLEAKPNSFVATRLKNSNGELTANEARRLLSKKIPFDNSFDITDTNKLFCSEMVNLVLKNIHNVEIFSQDAREFPFGSFFDTTKFEIIIDNRKLF